MIFCTAPHQLWSGVVKRLLYHIVAQLTEEFMGIILTLRQSC